ncbi:peroxiredoxin [Prolixibacteraceae bacterium JC049]|nr:peroxiredoxin [Prolixibacteraceae bacterium JC049]
MNKIEIGSTIPSFQLYDQKGQLIDISDYIGKQKLIIFFYPKNDTPGCTKEACLFRDHYEEFVDAGAMVIGIGKHSIEEQAQFAQKHRLNYTLLSDADNKIRKLFGVPKSLFGLLPGRVTYVVDRTGKVAYIFNSQTQIEKHIKQSLHIISEQP